MACTKGQRLRSGVEGGGAAAGTRMELSRSEVAAGAPVRGVGTLKVLPLAKSRRQKLVVGDAGGALTCWHKSKRGEVAQVFRTQVSEDENPVAAVVLNHGTSADKLYVAEGTSIRGVNKKGKVFCQIKTNLSEPLRQIVVRDSKIWVSGERTFASYADTKEQAYVNLDATITGLAVLRSDATAVLSCRNGRLYAVREAQVVAIFDAEGPVTCLEPYSDDGAALLFGTSSGRLGMVTFDEASNTFVSALQSEELNRGRRRRQRDELSGSDVAAINCICLHDLLKRGCADVLVGRDDGVLQVYRVEQSEEEGKDDEGCSRPQLQLQFERSVGESVRSIQGGVVSSPGFEEVVVCTFSGQITSFSTEALDQPEEGDRKGRSKAMVDAEGKRRSMEDELMRLEKDIGSARAKLAKLAGGRGGSKGEAATAAATAATALDFDQLQVHSTFVLDAELGHHVVSFELPVSIDSVLLQSKVAFKLLDNSSHGKNVVVTEIKRAGADGLEAVVRCSEKSKRVSIRLGTLEGQHGEIRATVTADVRPKLGQVVTLTVKPLSLHQLRSSPAAGLAKIPLSKVSFAGSFSRHQMHEWLRSCLPDLPAVPPEPLEGGDGDEEEETPVELHFENTLVKSVLVVRYRTGSATIESDSISAIAILREGITSEANKRKVGISMKLGLDPETVPFFLRKIDRQLCKQTQLRDCRDIAAALKEITNDGADDAGFLSAEHRKVLTQAHALDTQEAVRNPAALETLYGVVFDLFVDVRKFAGKDARNDDQAHSRLMQLLHDYDGVEPLLAFFETSSERVFVRPADMFILSRTSSICSSDSLPWSDGIRATASSKSSGLRFTSDTSSKLASLT